MGVISLHAVRDGEIITMKVFGAVHALHVRELLFPSISYTDVSQIGEALPPTGFTKGLCRPRKQKQGESPYGPSV